MLGRKQKLGRLEIQEQVRGDKETKKQTQEDSQSRKWSRDGWKED